MEKAPRNRPGFRASPIRSARTARLPEGLVKTARAWVGPARLSSAKASTRMVSPTRASGVRISRERRVGGVTSASGFSETTKKAGLPSGARITGLNSVEYAFLRPCSSVIMVEPTL